MDADFLLSDCELRPQSVDGNAGDVDGGFRADE